MKAPKVKRFICKLAGHDYDSAALVVAAFRVNSKQNHDDIVIQCRCCGHKEVIPGIGHRPHTATSTSNSGQTITLPTKETHTA